MMENDVLELIIDWFGSDYELLHYWESFGTYYIICRHSLSLYFLRVFPIGKKLELSQDKVMLLAFGGEL